jgi:PAS domain-containing protein
MVQVYQDSIGIGLSPFYDLFDELGEGICIHDGEGTILWSNRHLEDLAGCPPGSLAGTDAALFISCCFLPVHQKREVFEGFLRTTFLNGLRIRGLRCSLKGATGRQIEYSSHLMRRGPFAGLRLDRSREV